MTPLREEHANAAAVALIALSERFTEHRLLGAGVPQVRGNDVEQSHKQGDDVREAQPWAEPDEEPTQVGWMTSEPVRTVRYEDVIVADVVAGTQ